MQHAAAWAPSRLGEEGALRLVSRVDVNGFSTGAVQVFMDGAWGAVCTAGFDDVDAAVACRQLGFITGVSQVQDEESGKSAPDPVRFRRSHAVEHVAAGRVAGRCSLLYSLNAQPTQPLATPRTHLSCQRKTETWQLCAAVKINMTITSIAS